MATKKPAEKSAEKPAEKTKARVLLDCAYGKVDQVIEIEAADLAVAQASGHVDTDPAAVAYAESLQ